MHKYIQIFLEWMTSLSLNKYINNFIILRGTLQSLIRTVIHVSYKYHNIYETLNTAVFYEPTCLCKSAAG